jgi:hypothetical protein
MTLILLLTALFLPSVVYANEPLFQLGMLFTGATTLGGIFFSSFIGFLVILVVKSAVFVWKSDIRIMKAILYIFVANLASTSIGILAGTITSNIFSSLIWVIGFVISVVILYYLFLFPAKRLKNLPRFSRTPPRRIAIFLILITLLSSFIFALNILFQELPLIYWPLKIIGVTIALSLSLIISVVYEEAVISWLYEKEKKVQKSFMEPVIWCNVIAFGVVLLIGAIIALPKRFASPDFLIILFRHISIYS